MNRNNKIAIITGVLIVFLVVGLDIAPLKPSKVPQSPYAARTEYGVCLHISQFDPITTIQLEQLNTTWVRIDWVPEQMDEFVTVMKNNGFKILAIVDHKTMFQQNFTRLQWQSTVQSIMLTESAKEVDAWEIWNEPNADQFHFGYMDGSPQNYFEVLKDAYQIIKSSSPNAVVLAAGLAPYNFSYGAWRVG